jgi:hypothetical protein
MDVWSPDTVVIVLGLEPFVPLLASKSPAVRRAGRKTHTVLLYVQHVRFSQFSGSSRLALDNAVKR